MKPNGFGLKDVFCKRRWQGDLCAGLQAEGAGLHTEGPHLTSNPAYALRAGFIVKLDTYTLSKEWPHQPQASFYLLYSNSPSAEEESSNQEAM